MKIKNIFLVGCFIFAFILSCKKPELYPQLTVYDSVTQGKVINSKDSAIYSDASSTKDTLLYFNVLNIGKGELIIDDIIIDGKNASEFKLKKLESKLVPAGTSITMTLTFKNKSTESKFFNVTIKSNDIANPSYTFYVRVSFKKNFKYFEEWTNLLALNPFITVNINEYPNSNVDATYISNRRFLSLDIANNGSSLKIVIKNNLSFGQKLVIPLLVTAASTDQFLNENGNDVIIINAYNTLYSSYSRNLYYRAVSYEVGFTNNLDRSYDPVLSKKVDTDIELYENNNTNIPTRVIHLKQD